MDISMKLIFSVVILFFFSACDKKTKAKEEDMFKYDKVELLSEENNPIPKELYTLPMVDN
jgi:hypothetical protein